jgi:hypothetical protein
MPYVHCSNCHHEWETVNLFEKCRWCKAPIGKVLEWETPLEKTFRKRDVIMKRMRRNILDNHN